MPETYQSFTCAWCGRPFRRRTLEYNRRCPTCWGRGRRLTEEERFWANIQPRTNGCWIWTALKSPSGYGRFSCRRRSVPAHRWAYEFLIGPIPPDKVLDHLCRDRACSNPTHLEPVSSGVNALRGDGIPAQNARKVTCIYGHPFDAANTIVRTYGRSCRICVRDRSLRRTMLRKYKNRQRAAPLIWAELPAPGLIAPRDRHRQFRFIG